jgi:RNA polymerase-binding transcription factor DksA
MLAKTNKNSFNRVTYQKSMTKKMYSEEELKEFKAKILKEVEKVEFDIDSLTDKRNEVGQRSDHNVSYGDDSQADQLLLQTSALLEKKQDYLQKLQAALLRIENNSYGIDQSTGELIPKARLMAEPTATKGIK